MAARHVANDVSVSTWPSLWGSSGHVAAPCEHLLGEESLLKEMHDLVGPFASSDRLTVHLRAVRGKVRWAANRYLREELMGEVRPDFLPPPPSPPSPLPPSSLPSPSPLPSLSPLPPPSPCSPPSPRSPPHLPPTRPFDGACTDYTADTCQAGEVGSDTETGATQVDFLQLPEGVLDSTLSLLSPQDLCHVAASCTELHKLALSDNLWKALYKKRWGNLAVQSVERQLSSIESRESDDNREWMFKNCIQDEGREKGKKKTKEGGMIIGDGIMKAEKKIKEEQIIKGERIIKEEGIIQEEEVIRKEGSWKEMSRSEKMTSGSDSMVESWVEIAGRQGWWGIFQGQLACERTATCPHCTVARFVPIVYGFPSGRLVAGLREERLLLGGDHLTDSPGNPLWACLGCGSQWRTYPYCKQPEGICETSLSHREFL